MTLLHHVGVDIDYCRRNNQHSVLWTTACGLKCVDDSYISALTAKRYLELGPAFIARPHRAVNIRSIGVIVPEWSNAFQFMSSDCDTCDRYMQLKLLAGTEL
jgi:hypothetical protein